MRNRAIKPVPPALTVGTAKGTTTHVMPYPVKNDVQAPRWFAWGSGKAHAFLVPAGDPVGRVGTICKRTVDADKLSDGTGRDRCKTCASALAEDKRKRGTGLSEPVTEFVATGVQHGDTNGAELRRYAEISAISGDAVKNNAAIVSELNEGRKGRAMSLARELDERGPDAPVPHAGKTPIGNRDHGRLDGVAMVQGPNMEPFRKTWRNPVTKEIEPAAARLDGSLRERVDREIIPRDKPRRSKASGRRYRKAKQLERDVTARFKARGESVPRKGLPTAKQEAKRLRDLGRDLPKRGW